MTRPPAPPPSTRWILFALILIMGYAHHRWVYSPWRGEWEDLETRWVLMTSEIATSPRVLRAEDGALGDHVTRLTGRLRSLEAKLPDPQSIQHLPARIQMEARHWGLRLVSLRPEPINVDGPYAGERLHVTVEGRYHAAGRFLSALSSAAYLLKLSELRMLSLQERTQVRVSFWLDTYVRPWSDPADQVQIASRLVHPDGLLYPAEPLPDPMDLSEEHLHRPGRLGWPRLRMLFLASEPWRSVAAFDDTGEMVRGEGVTPTRGRLIRVRIGDRIAGARVVDIGAYGVQVHRDSVTAEGQQPEVIPLEPGPRRRPRLGTSPSGIEP